ncbi:MAG: hypothetical protein M3Z32_09945 [Acidobacteriota bacterium]|nr:hypothetical protein [Acidobacteriota bacterium]
MKTLEPFTPDPRWFEAPRERTPEFLTTYAKVSIGLQRALRGLAVRHFFIDLDRHRNQLSAYTLLAYASSRAFRPLSRTDFSYDVTNPAMMTMFFRMSRRRMTSALEERQAVVLAAGDTELARMYDPRHAEHVLRIVKKQKRFRKPLHRVLVAEGKLLNELMVFSGLAEAPPKERLKRSAIVMRKWRGILSHLCLGSDLSGIAPELFEATTNVYLAAGKTELLDLLWDDDEAPGEGAQTQARLPKLGELSRR